MVVEDQIHVLIMKFGIKCEDKEEILAFSLSIIDIPYES